MPLRESEVIRVIFLTRHTKNKPYGVITWLYSRYTNNDLGYLLESLFKLNKDNIQWQ
jgi:hypothetical protein